MPAVDGRGRPLLFLLLATALGGWRLLLPLWPAVLRGLRWQLLLRPAVLSLLLPLIKSAALHPRLRLLSQLLFLTLLLMLLQLMAACRSLTGCR